ncbi:MAG: tetratricopeptide repeat protein [Bdellovibrionales bacterium]|nr:tetratricopeptide repeat protein [Bdellovibrionales bacterium]
MMNKLTYILFLSSLFMTSCLMTRSEMKDSEQKQVMQQQVVTLQRTNADTNSRLAEIDEQLRAISGRIDLIENRMSKLNPESENKIKNLTEIQTGNNTKLSLFQEELTKQETSIQSLKSEMEAIKSALSNIQASKAQSSSTSKKNLYQEADSLYKQGEWKKAIIEYQKYRDKNPKGKYFPESTYKMALSFQQLGMKEEAKAFFEEVVSKFPKSSQTQKAKQKLKAMKK